MRKILLVALMLVSAMANGQGYGEFAEEKEAYQGDIAGFRIENESILWQHTYTATGMAKDSITKMLHRSLIYMTYVRSASVTDIGIYCQLDKFTYDLKKFKKQKFWADIFCDNISGDVLIEVKDEKYRVTVNKFESYGAPVLFPWNDCLQREGAWKGYSKTKIELETNDAALLDLFTIKAQAAKEW